MTWWGDIDATIEYAKTNVPRICAAFGGDPKKVILGDFPNDLAVHPHNDRWLLKESVERRKVWNWIDSVLQE